MGPATSQSGDPSQWEDGTSADFRRSFPTLEERALSYTYERNRKAFSEARRFGISSLGRLGGTTASPLVPTPLHLVFIRPSLNSLQVLSLSL